MNCKTFIVFTNTALHKSRENVFSLFWFFNVFLIKDCLNLALKLLFFVCLLSCLYLNVILPENVLLLTQLDHNYNLFQKLRWKILQ